MVLFPQPLEPTRATVSPGFTSIFKPLKTYCDIKNEVRNFVLWTSEHSFFENYTKIYTDLLFILDKWNFSWWQNVAVIFDDVQCGLSNKTCSILFKDSSDKSENVHD